MVVVYAEVIILGWQLDVGSRLDLEDEGEKNVWREDSEDNGEGFEIPFCIVNFYNKKLK